MFSALRQGNLFYILNKCDKSNGDLPSLKVGRVVSVEKPVSKYGNNYTNYTGIPQFGEEMVVDFSVVVDGENIDFKKLPANLSIADLGNGVIISESQEAMNAETEAMFSESSKAIDMVPYHQGVLDCRDAIRKILNPQYAKDREQEEKINALENKMGGIENTLQDMMGMLSKALNENNNNQKNK